MANVIIVGTDGSETAGKAAETAAGLASALGARLHVVCAYDSNAPAGQPSEDAGREFGAGHARGIAEIVERDMRELTSEVSSEITFGKPGDALIDAAARLEARLIVVGNRRVQGLTRILGSVATDVTRRAHCDVYIAHTV